MSASYTVVAAWDAEAGVWISRGNVPGLNIEAADLAEFAAVAADLASELIAYNTGNADATVTLAVDWTGVADQATVGYPRLLGGLQSD